MRIDRLRDMEEDTTFGPHRVVDVEEIDYIDIPGGVEILYALYLACLKRVEARYTYTYELLEALDEEDKDYAPVQPGEWVEISPDGEGGMEIKNLEKGGRRE